MEESSLGGLNALVESGEFMNISEAVRWCIRMQLNRLEGESGE